MNCPHCDKPIDEHEAGHETDVCMAVAVMGWRPGVSLPNHAGVMPADAKVVERGAWTHSKGGTYPYFVGGKHMTLFRGGKRRGMGESWHPSINIAAAWEVHQHMMGKRFSKRSRYLHKLSVIVQKPFGRNLVAWPDALRFFDEMAICRAALKASGGG